MDALITAIMVNWNGAQLVETALTSVLAQKPAIRIVFVDNNSCDESSSIPGRLTKDILVVHNKCNAGYAAASNQALKLKIVSKYILLLNNDVIFPDCLGLPKAVEYLESHPDEHGVCGRYEYPNGTFQRFYNQLPTPFNMAVSWGCGRHIPGLLPHPTTRQYYLLDADFSQRFYIDQPAFSCVLLRRTSANRVGFLDERFPIFFNDVDYCWRWRSHGMKWMYLPDWRIIHHHSYSTSKMQSLRSAELFSSAINFSRKHFRPSIAWRVTVMIFLEACWRKYRHGDFAVPLGAIWEGDTFFRDLSDAKTTETLIKP